ncbi:MAG: DUF1450 domain-containing protein [Tumebacillaceae bacterium]
MSKNIKKIDVCIGNLDKGTEWVIDQLKQEFPHLEGQRWGCLGNCGDCYKKPFILGNNRYLIDATSKEELLEKIRTEIVVPEENQG